MDCQPGSQPAIATSILGGVNYGQEATTPNVCYKTVNADTNLLDIIGNISADEYFTAFGEVLEGVAVQTLIGGATVLVPAILSGGASIPLQFASTIAKAVDAPRELVQSIAAANAAYTLGQTWEVAMANGDFFGDLFSGDLFTDFSITDYLPSSETFSSLAQFAAPVISAFTSPQASALPVARPGIGTQPGFGIQTMAAMPTISGGLSRSSYIKAITGPILAKVGAYLQMSKLPSISRVLQLAKDLGRTMLPASVAVALGITAQELATLIIHKRKRRRMNPGNTRALRRSMRRVESFHRLAMKADVLRSRGRRGSSARGRCGTCKASPCRC